MYPKSSPHQSQLNCTESQQRLQLVVTGKGKAVNPGGRAAGLANGD
jgi:hypothetical protein